MRCSENDSRKESSRPPSRIAATAAPWVRSRDGRRLEIAHEQDLARRCCARGVSCSITSSRFDVKRAPGVDRRRARPFARRIVEAHLGEQRAGARIQAGEPHVRIDRQHLERFARGLGVVEGDRRGGVVEHQLGLGGRGRCACRRGSGSNPRSSTPSRRRRARCCWSSSAAPRASGGSRGARAWLMARHPPRQAEEPAADREILLRRGAAVDVEAHAILIAHERDHQCRRRACRRRPSGSGGRAPPSIHAAASGDAASPT